MSDFNEIFHDKSSERCAKINKLKSKLDGLIEEGTWKPCQIFLQLIIVLSLIALGCKCIMCAGMLQKNFIKNKML